MLDDFLFELELRSVALDKPSEGGMSARPIRRTHSVSFGEDGCHVHEKKGKSEGVVLHLVEKLRSVTFTHSSRLLLRLVFPLPSQYPKLGSSFPSPLQLGQLGQ